MSSSVLLVLLSLSALTVSMVAMPTPCPVRRQLVNESLKLLQKLGGRDFPVSCLPYNHNISFPNFIFPWTAANHVQCDQALRLVYASLEGAELMFENYTDDEMWAELKWNELQVDVFRNIQNQLLEEGQCLSDPGSVEVFSPYFNNMTTIVQQQVGRAECGWAVLRRDLLTVLNSTLHKYHNCLS